MNDIISKYDSKQDLKIKLYVGNKNVLDDNQASDLLKRIKHLQINR